MKKPGPMADVAIRKAAPKMVDLKELLVFVSLVIETEL